MLDNKEMPEAVDTAASALRNEACGFHQGARRERELNQIADALESFWRTHAAQPKVAMTEELEDLLDSIMSFADVDPDTQVKQIWRRKVAAVRAQAAGVKLPKVRSYLEALGKPTSPALTAALAELDAAERLAK